MFNMPTQLGFQSSSKLNFRFAYVSMDAGSFKDEPPAEMPRLTQMGLPTG
jgi:hypothetical protein